MYPQYHKKKITKILMKIGHLLNLYEVLGSVLNTYHMCTHGLIYCDIDCEENLDSPRHVVVVTKEKYFNNLSMNVVTPLDITSKLNRQVVHCDRESQTS